MLVYVTSFLGQTQFWNTALTFGVDSSPQNSFYRRAHAMFHNFISQSEILIYGTEFELSALPGGIWVRWWEDFADQVGSVILERLID